MAEPFAGVAPRRQASCRGQDAILAMASEKYFGHQKKLLLF